ncbi:MAG: hypothetical protein OXF02_03560 [Simkaniaceae bacterium]|nr:hypothetical protein [Simkaniaceae bacterium]
MFNKVTILSLLLLCSLFSSTLYLMYRLDPKSDSFSEEDRLASSSRFTRTTQLRHNVRKDLWTAGDKRRLYGRITCSRSFLHPSTPEGHTTPEYVEEMETVTCSIRANGEGEADKITLIRSEKGTYRYSEQAFRAPDAYISRFRLRPPLCERNDAIDVDPECALLLRGKAREVLFSPNAGGTGFRAETFRVRIPGGTDST